KVAKTELQKSNPEIKASLGQNSERKSLPKKVQVSTTRGGKAECSEEKSIELEFSAVKEDLVFKWKKVPNAAKYHLYISDDDEILIDEFETEGETSFILRKPLDTLKTYKWKILITLDNGKTVVSPYNKFTVREYETNRLKQEKKMNAEIRCTGNN